MRAKKKSPVKLKISNKKISVDPPKGYHWMEEGGRLLIEHGFNQRSVLSKFAESKGLVVLEQIDDLSGLPRVLVLGK